MRVHVSVAKVCGRMWWTPFLSRSLCSTHIFNHFYILCLLSRSGLSRGHMPGPHLSQPRACPCCAACVCVLNQTLALPWWTSQAVFKVELGKGRLYGGCSVAMGNRTCVFRMWFWSQCVCLRDGTEIVFEGECWGNRLAQVALLISACDPTQHMLRGHTSRHTQIHPLCTLPACPHSHKLVYCSMLSHNHSLRVCVWGGGGLMDTISKFKQCIMFMVK